MKILIPLDDSELSQSVLPWVHTLFGASPGAEVHLLTVTDPSKATSKVDWAHSNTSPPTSAGTMVIGAHYPRVVESHGQALERVHTEAEERLRTIAADALPEFTVHVHSAWSEHTVDEIVRMATEVKADVIAMATHGRSGVSHLVAGSVAEGVIRKSGRPVLVYRPSTDA